MNIIIHLFTTPIKLYTQHVSKTELNKKQTKKWKLPSVVKFYAGIFSSPLKTRFVVLSIFRFRTAMGNKIHIHFSIIQFNGFWFIDFLLQIYIIRLSNPQMFSLSTAWWMKMNFQPQNFYQPYQLTSVIDWKINQTERIGTGEKPGFT